MSKPFKAESLGINFAADGNAGTLNNLPSKSLIKLFAGATVDDGTGTLTLQASPDGGTTWVAVPTWSYTAETANQLVDKDEVYGSDIRLNLASSTSPDLDLDIQAFEVDNNDPILALNASTTVDSNSNEFVIPDWVTELGFFAWGTWDSNTVKLQYTIDGGTTWKDVASGSLTANGMLILDVTDLGGHFRVNNASGTTIVTSAKIYY